MIRPGLSGDRAFDGVDGSSGWNSPLGPAPQPRPKPDPGPAPWPWPPDRKA
ncbi:MAG TPA: hypothetical protein VK661_09260 [Planctomycetota bacterium]|nr:hypothetical protein [Planctomycetota bacterium]